MWWLIERSKVPRSAHPWRTGRRSTGRSWGRGPGWTRRPGRARGARRPPPSPPPSCCRCSGTGAACTRSASRGWSRSPRRRPSCCTRQFTQVHSTRTRTKRQSRWTTTVRVYCKWLHEQRVPCAVCSVLVCRCTRIAWSSSGTWRSRRPPPRGTGSPRPSGTCPAPPSCTPPSRTRPASSPSRSRSARRTWAGPPSSTPASHSLTTRASTVLQG